MRIHTDLTRAEVAAIIGTVPASVSADHLTEHGSRSGKARGIELKLTGTSNRKRNDDSGENAATWDEWGIVLNALYDADPTMIVGSKASPIYADRDDFHHKTEDRFHDLTAVSQHFQHRWKFVTAGRFECTQCGAGLRH